ncbi:MAG: restriction endonuclease [Shimia sp.]|uniref:nSTAND3 domain-containing NTPase n=1 Tax=Shimia sp. TaxID=1954381 RepID=UPI003B8C6C5B
MPQYDFQQLSPFDLEILARDLLQAHWGVTIESFKSGKDGGVDLRYAVGTNRLIVQVKHYLKTGLAGLMREVKKEVEKVRLINPSRYLLVTSVPLSKANKDSIVDLFDPGMLKASDVIGHEDLNNLLGQHPEIERNHYKLWLASRAVLDGVLHNAEKTRSEFKVRQVYEEARRYVQSEAYPQAMQMLNNSRVVVIAGPPGVGKTTLANLLLYAHLEGGYQAVLIQRDIDEGLKLFQPGTPQVFYFDDFMGATFLGDGSAALAGSNDKALLEFINMVRATPTAKLILTTREHIYSHAMGRSERLRHSDLDDLRVFLRMPSYSFSQKARILYNHLCFSDLPPEYQGELLRDEFYMSIIKHEKFNPRLIEWLSSFRRLRNVPVDKYRSFVENLLRDPSEIWRHAFENEISDAGRSMLLAIFSLEGRANGAILKAAFTTLHEHRANRYGFSSGPEDFRTALREIAGTFIKPIGSHGFEVIDPSVLDLLNSVVLVDPENAIDIMTGAASFDQIKRIWSFAKSKSRRSILEAFRMKANQIADPISIQMLKRRRFDHGNGSVSYRGSTFERRLAVLLDIAEKLGSDNITSLVPVLFSRLEHEWLSESPEINDAVELVRTLQACKSVSQDEADRMLNIIKPVLLKEIGTGCRSDELRELIGVLDLTDHCGTKKAAQAAFEAYRRLQFADEVGECKSGEQFDELIEDLELFRDELGVEIAAMLDTVEEAKFEFEANEEAWADHMQDEWKERSRDERASARGVSDMFGSLRVEQ